MRDRGHARDPDRERARTSTDPAPFDGARVVGVTGGTSTPIEDLRDVAERIITLAGTPDMQARAAELARAPWTQPRPRPVAPPRCRSSRSPRARPDRGLRAPPALPVVAFVGRPNVGKSTLFNRVVGDARAAIVEDRARTTRDRLYGDAEWNGRRFVVVDTGGLEISPGDPIEEQVQLQARLAISEADVIVFLVDAAAGPTPADQDAAELLRKTTKPVLVAANKADNQQRELTPPSSTPSAGTTRSRSPRATGAASRTCSTPSCGRCRPRADAEIARKTREARGRGVGEGDGRPAGSSRTSSSEADETDDDDDGDDDDDADGAAASRRSRPLGRPMAADDDEPPAIAFVGRPNVGKSSLLNALLGEERAIVSATPGTTRDAIDTTIPWGRSEVVLIDTAGHQASRQGRVRACRRASTRRMRALKAISRADVAVLVLDAPTA